MNELIVAGPVAGWPPFQPSTSQNIAPRDNARGDVNIGEELRRDDEHPRARPRERGPGVAEVTARIPQRPVDHHQHLPRPSGGLFSRRDAWQARKAAPSPSVTLIIWSPAVSTGRYCSASRTAKP